MRLLSVKTVRVVSLVSLPSLPLCHITHQNFLSFLWVLVESNREYLMHSERHPDKVHNQTKITGHPFIRFGETVNAHNGRLTSWMQHGPCTCHQ
jgi:hypothetical protein